MILEAFSQQLRERYGQHLSSEQILHQWLLSILCQPADCADHVSRVIHTEIEIQSRQGQTGFVGTSDSGQRLLESLYQYCRSYEQWQFSRWLHHMRASDFPIP